MKDEMDDMGQINDFGESSFESHGAAENEKLRSLMRTWEAPDVPPSLDTRMLDSFYRHVRRTPMWRRMLSATIPVPVPAAAVFLTLFLAATVSTIRMLWPSYPHSNQGDSALAQGHHPMEGTNLNTSDIKQETARQLAQHSGAIGETNFIGQPRPGSAPTVSTPTILQSFSSYPNPAKQGGRTFALSLQSDQGTIHIFTKSDYQWSSSPKIFVGSQLDPSVERREP